MCAGYWTDGAPRNPPVDGEHGPQLLDRRDGPARAPAEAGRAERQVRVEARAVAGQVRGGLRGLGPGGGPDEQEYTGRVPRVAGAAGLLQVGRALQARGPDEGPAAGPAAAHEGERAGHGGLCGVDAGVQGVPRAAPAGRAVPARAGGPDVRGVQAEHAGRVHDAAGEAGRAPVHAQGIRGRPAVCAGALRGGRGRAGADAPARAGEHG